MQGLKKIISIFLMVTVVATIRYCSKAAKRNPSEIVVGTSADFEPFSFIDKTGTIVGFDIDLLDAVFKRLNRHYRLENMPFETLLTQMQFGSIDVIAAGMSPTPEREARILFSTPYIQAEPLVIMTLSNHKDINALQDLFGKTVAVNQGYVADMQLSLKPEIKLLRLPGLSDALLALKHGKVDALVTGGGTIKPLQSAFAADAIRIIPIKELQEDFAFCIAKRHPELKEKIDAILQDLRDDGTLVRLKEKWRLC